MKILKSDLIDYIRCSIDILRGPGPGDNVLRQKIIDIIHEYYKMKNKKRGKK